MLFSTANGNGNGIGTSVLLKSYREVNRDFRPDEEIGNAYPFCALSCVAHVQHWAKNKGISDRRIKYVFEHGAEHKGQFLERCKSLMSVSPILMGKDTIPLQLADFVAWENRRVMVHLQDR
jgi:hypothetical protein